MNLPATVKRWGESITVGILVGGLIGAGLVKSGVWVIRVNDHMKWGSERSEAIDARFEKAETRQEWMIHVLYKLAAHAGVSMPALPIGIDVTPRPTSPPGAGLYAAEPDQIRPVRPTPKP